MTSNDTADAPKLDRFGFDFGIATSKRRAEMAAARKDGESFDGLTDRDVALMVERGQHAIMAAQTVRGRFLGDVNEVSVTAVYLAATAASEDAIQLFDAIAERKADLRVLLKKIRDYHEAVEEERKRDEEHRRAADAASIVAAAANADTGNKNAGASRPAAALGGPDGMHAASNPKPTGEPRQGS